MTASDIISLWPSAEHFAADLACKHLSYGRVMKMRGRIPSKYWAAVIAAAEKRNITGVTKLVLEEAHCAPAQAAA